MLTLTGQHYSENAIIEGVHTTMELEQQKHVFQMLNPRLEIDGNQWCCIWGAMPELYIAGFGDTPAQAIRNFVSDYYTSKIPTKA